MTGRLLAAAALALAGTGRWSPPVALSGPSQNCPPGKCLTRPAVVLDARGDAIASWTSFTGVGVSSCLYATRSAARAWSVPLPLPSSQPCPSTGIDSNGRGTAVWVTSQDGRNVVLAQVRSTSGEWLRGQRISPAGENADKPQIAVDDAHALAAWIAPGGPYGVEVAMRTGASRFGTDHLVLRGASAPPSVAVALGSRGDGAVGWSASVAGRQRTQVAVKAVSGPWLQPETLAQAPLAPALALDGRGDAIAAWADDGVSASYRPAGRRFGSPRRLAASGGSVTVAFAASGAAVVVWLEGSVVREASRSASGAWSPSATISSPVESAGDPTLAVAPNGEAVVVWVNEHQTVDGALQTIQAAVRPPGGQFGNVTQLSPEARLGGQPAVAIDNRGNAVVVWEGVNGVVESASFG